MRTTKFSLQSLAGALLYAHTILLAQASIDQAPVDRPQFVRAEFSNHGDKDLEGIYQWDSTRYVPHTPTVPKGRSPKGHAKAMKLIPVDASARIDYISDAGEYHLTSSKSYYYMTRSGLNMTTGWTVMHNDGRGFKDSTMKVYPCTNEGKYTGKPFQDIPKSSLKKKIKLYGTNRVFPNRTSGKGIDGTYTLITDDGVYYENKKKRARIIWNLKQKRWEIKRLCMVTHCIRDYPCLIQKACGVDQDLVAPIPQVPAMWWDYYHSKRAGRSTSYMLTVWL